MAVARLLPFLVLLADGVAAQSAPTWARDPTSGSQQIRVLIRADDFGYTHASNAAFRQLAGKGAVTAASLMAVGPWFTEAVQVARAYPSVSIGLHLAITSEWRSLRWGPILGADRVPTLVSPDGYFYKNYWTRNLRDLPAEARAIRTDQLPPIHDVDAEIRAQVAFAHRQGLQLDYLDCHMGATCLPPVRSAMIRLAEELCLPIPEHGWMGDQEVGFEVTESAATTIANFARLLDTLRPGLYRVVTHPAVNTEELRAVDSLDGESEARKRQAALDALLSPEIAAVIRRRSIQLVSIRDLWDARTCRLR